MKNNFILKPFVFSFLFLAMFSAASASEIIGGLSNQGSVPVAPASKTATVSGTTVTVTWSAVANVGGYKLYRSKDAGVFTLVADNITALSYVDAGLSAGLYSYQVQPFLGALVPALSVIVPTAPVTVVDVTTPAPASSGGGGGGGGGGSGSFVPVSTTTPSTPTSLNVEAQKVDANKDNKVDVLDFVALMANWGKVGVVATGDFNSDNKVDILDFVLLMANWTK